MASKAFKADSSIKEGLIDDSAFWDAGFAGTCSYDVILPF